MVGNVHSWHYLDVLAIIFINVWALLSDVETWISFLTVVIAFVVAILRLKRELKNRVKKNVK